MTDKALSAYDLDTTPNPLADVVGQDIEVSTAPPITPTPVGETLLDAETGQVRHIPPNKDGSPVQISTGGDNPGDKEGDR